MPPEPTTPIEPEVAQESTVEPVVSEPVFSPPANEEMPKAEEVIEAPVPEPVVEAPISEPVVIAPEPIPEPVVLPEPEVIVPTEPTPEPILASEPVVLPYPESSQTPKTTNQSSSPNPTIPTEVYHHTHISVDNIGVVAMSFIKSMQNSKEHLSLANAAIQAKMMKRVHKVMDLFDKKKEIKNRDVRDFLHVSEDTAKDYFKILIKEGKIKREGKSIATHYTKV